MAIVVQKFGGTSLATIERILHVATLLCKISAYEKQKGNHLVVVVSAMAGTTDMLSRYIEDIGGLHAHPNAETDMVLSSGEQITAGLLAIALQYKGIKARSWLGWQVGITTDMLFGNAHIEEISTDLLKESFKKDEIPIIAGFQGCTKDQRITTLGRGGSDISAVALSAALHAVRCDIYTDVEGIYTADPRIVQKAKKLRYITYEEMLEMASLGAKVLQTRSVEMAMKYNIPIQVLSSFTETPGTILINEEDHVERELITGITYNAHEICITLTHIPHKPGFTGRVFEHLAEAEINVDMIVQQVKVNEPTISITFTINRLSLDVAKSVLTHNKGHIGFEEMHILQDITKISVIGVGMRSHAGLAQKMFSTLGEKTINILVISTSEIKISVLIQAEYTELALRSLHTAYGLDAAEELP